MQELQVRWHFLLLERSSSEGWVLLMNLDMDYIMLKQLELERLQQVQQQEEDRVSLQNLDQSSGDLVRNWSMGKGCTQQEM